MFTDIKKYGHECKVCECFICKLAENGTCKKCLECNGKGTFENFTMECPRYDESEELKKVLKLNIDIYDV